MEIIQAFLMICFAAFCIIGEGSHTTIRLCISWIIVTFIIVISLAYLIFSILCFILWSCKTFKGIDYIENWNQNENLTANSDGNS